MQNTNITAEYSSVDETSNAELSCDAPSVCVEGIDYRIKLQGSEEEIAKITTMLVIPNIQGDFYILSRELKTEVKVIQFINSASGSASHQCSRISQAPIKRTKVFEIVAGEIVEIDELPEYSFPTPSSIEFQRPIIGSITVVETYAELVAKFRIRPTLIYRYPFLIEASETETSTTHPITLAFFDEAGEFVATACATMVRLDANLANHKGTTHSEADYSPTANEIEEASDLKSCLAEGPSRKNTCAWNSVS